MVSDGRLMERIRRDDEQAFTALFERHGPAAKRLARGICRDRDRAEQAVQEAFVNAWTGRATYRPERGPVDAWLMSIVRHRALRVARGDLRLARRLAPADALDDVQDTADVAGDVLAADDARRFAELLMRLPAAQREVIVLAFYGELTHREISRRLNLPAGTVKGRMRLGLGKLRVSFGV